MPELGTQLRTYFDEIDPPFTLDELIPAIEPSSIEQDYDLIGEPPVPRVPPRRPGWAVALAAWVAVAWVAPVVGDTRPRIRARNDEIDSQV